MEISNLLARNWSQAFQVWVDDIQVCFQPVVRMQIQGGFLRKVRGATRVGAGVLALFFSLHCTRSRALEAKVVPPMLERAPEVRKAKASVFTEEGFASWYGGEDDGFSGQPTASGELFDETKLTCAHRTLPFGTLLEVVNLETDQRVVVRVNDRGPFARGRMLDLSRQAAQTVGILEQGEARVRIQSIKRDGTPAVVEADADEANPYTVQVAALTDPSNIQRLSRTLSTRFSQVSCQEVTAKNGRKVTRVLVGAYASLDEAEKASGDIAKYFGDRGVEPFITRRR